MQAVTELTIDDFEIVEDLLLTGEDFLMEKALTAKEFNAACEKIIVNCHLAKTKAEYRHSFNCFGKPTDENVSLILLNILCANTGNGKNSRKCDLVRRIDYLGKCKTNKESALWIERKIDELKKSLGIEDDTTFATIRLTHKEGKIATYSTLYVDKRQLTGKKLCQAIKAAGCSEEFLYQSRPLDDRNAVVRLLKIMEQDLLLAFRVISLVFDLDIHAGDKPDSVVMTFLHGFMWSFVAGKISNPDCNLYVLTRDYWESLFEDLGKYCVENSIHIRELDVIRKNMYLFNPGCSETAPFMWYPDIVLKNLRNLSEAFNRLPNSRFSEACSKLNHFLDIFDLQARNLWLSYTIPSEKDAQLLYVNAMLNGFWPLVAQINDAPFARLLTPDYAKPEQLPYKDLPANTREAFIPDPVFRSTDEHLLYKTKIMRQVYHEAIHDYDYSVPAHYSDEYYRLIKLPFDLWWSCNEGFSPTKNAYDTKPEDITTYMGLPEICLAKTGSEKVPDSSVYSGWLSSLGFPLNPRSHTVAYRDIKSACHIAFYSNLLVSKSKSWSLIANEYTAIPQAKLLICKLIEHKNNCSNLAVKKYVDDVVGEYLMKAAANKQYSMVLFLASYQNTPQGMDICAQTLCANEATRDAGMMLKKELSLLLSMEWWLALNQIANTAPKEVKQHIFGFFSAVCAKERESVALEIEPVVPK